MDRLSVYMVRTSLVYLGAGFLIGAILLAAEGIRLSIPLLSLGVVHAHLLFVGWLVQFGLGVAYWLLPRKRTPERPLAYSARWGFAAYGLLNSGLLLRAVFEPSRLLLPDLAAIALVLSSVLQLVAGVIFIVQLWNRVRPAPNQATTRQNKG